MKIRIVLLVLLSTLICGIVLASECVKCHLNVTPNQVKDWQLSKHAEHDIDCSVCHGDLHKTADDFANVLIEIICTSQYPI